MYKIILTIGIILILSIKVFSIEDTSNDKLIISSINFEGLKRTNPKYLYSKIKIKKGDIWNKSVKTEVNNILKNNLTGIIEEVEIIELINNTNNTVDLTFKILEKGAFIVAPYPQYSNSGGLKLKLIFRYYNLGGYRKYLNTKLEFNPTDSLFFYLLYRDPEVFNNPNLSYELSSEFNTSVINFYANADPYGNPRGFPPLGVINGDTQARWNNELYVKEKFSASINYKFPGTDIEINPKVCFDYKRTIDKINITNASQLPIEKIIPETGINLIFPIKAINASFRPAFNIKYDLTLGNENLQVSPIPNSPVISDQTPDLTNKFYGSAYDSLIPEIKLAFNFNIPAIGATIEPSIKLVYEKVTNYDFKRNGTSTISPIGTDHYLDLIFGLNFSKSVTFNNIEHSFNIKTEFNQRLYGNTYFTTTYYYSDGTVASSKTKPYTFYNSFSFDFTYGFDFNFLIHHHFIMKWNFFSRYNGTTGYNIKEVVAYIISEPNFVRMPGYLGLNGKLKYVLPLFNVNTNRFASINIKRELKWQVYWDFILYFGLSLNNNDDINDMTNPGKGYKYTFDYNYLHIYPAGGIGTAIRVVPMFLPIEIEVAFGLDLYQLIQEKDLVGSAYLLSFSINDKL